MIRRGFNSIVNKKIDTILELIKDSDIKFDNTNPNHYKLIMNNKEFEFTTYNDVINATKLLKEKIGE